MVSFKAKQICSKFTRSFQQTIVGASILITGEMPLVQRKNGRNVDYNLAEDPGYGKRHIIAILLFILLGVSTALRSNMTIAILAMTDKDNLTEQIVYDWNKVQIGFVMSSASWGDILVQFIAGPLANRYGSKKVLTVSTVVTGVLMMLTPWFAKVAGWIGVCITTSIQGAFQGVIAPCIHTLIGKWSPVKERTRYGAFIYGGMYTALIVTPPITAFICSSSLGWPWSFYIFGAQSFIGCLVWISFGASSPTKHKSISEKEKVYIEQDLDLDDKVKLNYKTPMKSIMTSAPVLALIVTQCGCIWGFTVIYIETPVYFKKALGMDLENSGLFVSLSYLMALTMSVVTSIMADYILKKKIMSLTSIRKLCNTFGSWIPALFMVFVTYVPVEFLSLSLTLFILLVGSDAMNSCGFLINHVDLSPNFAGVLVGIASFFSGIVGILAPISTGYLVNNMADVTEWRKVYMIAAGFYFIGNLIYLIFGSGNTQSWNKPIYDEVDQGEKMQEKKT